MSWPTEHRIEFPEESFFEVPCDRSVDGVHVIYNDLFCLECGRVSDPGRRTKKSGRARVHEVGPHLVIRDGRNCQICFRPLMPDEPNSKWAPTVEHVVALRDGGSNALRNLVLAHYKCNYGRHHRKDGSER